MDKTDFCSPRLAKMLFYPYLGTFINQSRSGKDKLNNRQVEKQKDGRANTQTLTYFAWADLEVAVEVWVLFQCLILYGGVTSAS